MDLLQLIILAWLPIAFDKFLESWKVLAQSRTASPVYTELLWPVFYPRNEVRMHRAFLPNARYWFAQSLLKRYPKLWGNTAVLGTAGRVRDFGRLLDDEMQRDTWLTHPASLELVFHSKPELLWQHILLQKGWRYRLLAQSPEDYSVN